MNAFCLKKYNLLFYAFFILTATIGHGQKLDLGSWTIFNVKYTLTSKWGLFSEYQIRSLKPYDNFHYYEFKAGVNYKISDHVKVTLGAGTYQTYSEEGNFNLPKNNDEFRIWPQVVFTQQLGRLKIEQRYRTELRFTSNGYRNRFRYRFGAALPFGKKYNGIQPFELNISNELFFTDNEPFFERNRLQFLLNYNLSKNSTLQTGYIHQFDYKINDEIGRDFFVFGLYYDLFSKKIKPSKKQTESIDVF